MPNPEIKYSQFRTTLTLKQILLELNHSLGSSVKGDRKSEPSLQHLCHCHEETLYPSPRDNAKYIRKPFSTAMAV